MAKHWRSMGPHKSAFPPSAPMKEYLAKIKKMYCFSNHHTEAFVCRRCKDRSQCLEAQIEKQTKDAQADGQS